MHEQEKERKRKTSQKHCKKGLAGGSHPGRRVVPVKRVPPVLPATPPSKKSLETANKDFDKAIDILQTGMD